MKVVKVYGALRKKLGQCRFQFEADTPAQALKALCVNFPWLTQWLIDSEQDGVSYRVTISKEKITNETAAALVLPWSEREVFSITPVLTGAGGGSAGTILAGVGLIALAIVAGPAAGGFLGLGAGLGGSGGVVAATSIVGSSFGLISGAAASAIGFVGVSLVLGGIAQALSPSPVQSAVGFSTTRGSDAAKFESFSFSGIVNTAKQGMPVPIAYGRVYVGSAVISSGLDVDQLK
jgi:predicted phage tail protein